MIIFDLPKNRKLGAICARGHNWNRTGMSLRRVFNGKDSGCYECCVLSRKLYACRRRARLANRLIILPQPEDLKTVFDFFDNRCAYCGSPDNLSLDHFTPLSKGGADAIYNFIPACRSCNSSKNAKDPFEWMEVNVDIIQSLPIIKYLAQFPENHYLTD